MSQEGPREQPAPIRGAPEANGVEVRTVSPGTKLRLTDGSIVEVTQNPEDGYWIIARYIESPEEPSRVGSEDTVFWSDILTRA